MPQTTLLQASLLNDPTTKWIVLLFAAFALVYITFIRPLRKKRDPLAKSPAASTLSQQRSVERDMSNLLVELSEMARQMTAQLDTRTAKLELLIKEADEKIAALRAASGGGSMMTPAEKSPEAKDFSDPSPAPARAALIEAAPPPIDPRHAAVYELADEGRSPLEIAQTLGRPSGEIELILALRSDA